MASLEYFVLFPVAGAVGKKIRREYRWGRDGQAFQGIAHLLQATANPIHEDLHGVRQCAFADIGISAILSCPYGVVASSMWATRAVGRRWLPEFESNRKRS